MFDIHNFVRLPRRRRHGIVALLTALAFAFLLATAASHRHQGGAEAGACVACGVAANQLGGASVPPGPAPALVLLPYRTVAATGYHCCFAAPRVLPPSRGPPRP